MLLSSQVGCLLGGVAEVEAEEPYYSPTPYCARIWPSSLTVQQPVGLDWPALLALHGLESRWGSKKQTHKLAFIVHAVIEGRYRDTRNDTPGNYVPLCSRWLQKFTQAEDTPQAIRDLLKMGVLEKHAGNYRVGHYPQKFRLSPAYSERTLVSVVLENPTLAKKVAKDQADRNHSAVDENPVRAAVFANLTSLSFADGAKASAKSWAYRNSAQRAAWSLSLADIDQGRLWLASDKDTGRIFHNGTQCPRELRKFLLIDGGKTAEVDIGNAQPYFMLSLYPYGATGALATERDDFALTATSGDFYEALFHLCGTKARWGGERAGSLGFLSEEGRDRFKKYTLQHVMYGTTTKEEGGKRVAKPEAQVFRSFREQFPWLAGELSWLRRDEAGTSELAKRLQKQEADLILGRVVPRILRELPACKPITLHDGILCQRRFASAVQQIVQDEAKIVYGGRPPKVRVKWEDV